MFVSFEPDLRTVEFVTANGTCSVGTSRRSPFRIAGNGGYVVVGQNAVNVATQWPRLEFFHILNDGSADPNGYINLRTAAADRDVYVDLHNGTAIGSCVLTGGYAGNTDIDVAVLGSGVQQAGIQSVCTDPARFESVDWGNSIHIHNDTILIGRSVLTRTGSTWSEQDMLNSEITTDAIAVLGGLWGDRIVLTNGTTWYTYSRSGSTWTLVDTAVSMPAGAVGCRMVGDFFMTSSNIYRWNGSTWVTTGVSNAVALGYERYLDSSDNAYNWNGSTWALDQALSFDASFNGWAYADTSSDQQVVGRVSTDFSTTNIAQVRGYFGVTLP